MKRKLIAAASAILLLVLLAAYIYPQTLATMLPDGVDEISVSFFCYDEKTGGTATEDHYYSPGDKEFDEIYGLYSGKAYRDKLTLHNLLPQWFNAGPKRVKAFALVYFGSGDRSVTIQVYGSGHIVLNRMDHKHNLYFERDVFTDFGKTADTRLFDATLEAVGIEWESWR